MGFWAQICIGKLQTMEFGELVRGAWRYFDGLKSGVTYGGIDSVGFGGFEWGYGRKLAKLQPGGIVEASGASTKALNRCRRGLPSRVYRPDNVTGTVQSSFDAQPLALMLGRVFFPNGNYVFVRWRKPEKYTVILQGRLVKRQIVRGSRVARDERVVSQKPTLQRGALDTYIGKHPDIEDGLNSFSFQVRIQRGIRKRSVRVPKHFTLTVEPFGQLLIIFGTW